MKVLTIITTIFIPLSLIPSLYGMNMKLPGAESAWAFEVILLLMTLMGVAMVVYFQRKKWM
jgi:magnesium transporter